MIAKNLPNGFAVQSVILAKAQFAKAEDASLWVKGVGGDASDLEENGLNWVFHQFPKPDGESLSERETEDPGVVVKICKHSQEKAMPNSDTNDMDGGERHDLETGHEELPNMPQGAATLAKLKALVDEGAADLERHKGLLEHPAIKEYAEDSHEELNDASDHLAKCMKEWYPEVKADKPKKDEPAEESETDNQYAKHYKACRRWARKSADGMEYMRDHPNSSEPAETGAKMPFEAKVMVKAMDSLHMAHQAVQEDLPLQAHPDVKAMMEHLDQELPERKNALCGMMKEHFPEVHKALGWENAEAEADDKPDGDADGKKEKPAEAEEGKKGGDEAKPEKEPEKKPAKDDDDKKEKAHKDEKSVDRMVVYSRKDLKSGDHYVEVCTCGVVMGQCKCVAKHKKTLVTTNGCPDCQKKAKAGQSIVKAIPFLKAPTKPAKKAGANVVEPPMAPSESPDNVDDSVVMDGDPLAILQGLVEYLQDCMAALGGAKADDENPYEEPHRPAPGKEADDEETIEKGDEPTEDEEESVTKDKDGDGDKDEEEEEGPFSKAEMIEIAKALADIKKTAEDDSKRFALLAGGTMN